MVSTLWAKKYPGDHFEDTAKYMLLKVLTTPLFFSTRCSIDIGYSSGVPGIQETVDLIVNGMLSILRSVALQLKSSIAGD